MPTIPKRASSALATVERLLPQCSRFYVHLDGYVSTPSWMPSEVRCFVHPQARGPSVRFSVLPDEEYVLFVDDDLRHPADYVKQSTKNLERLGPGTAIAYHAGWWPSGSPPQFRHRRVIAFWDASPDDQAVTYVGSGTLALRTDDLRAVDRSVPDHFRLEDDVWISGALARAGIRCVRPKTRKDWIRPTNTGSHGLWTAAAKDGFKRRDACITDVLGRGRWKLTR